MSFGTTKQSICLDDILNKVRDVDILNYYFGISTLPILINSPLRNDKSASLSIFINKSGDIILKDFGTFKSYNIWSFLMELWCCSYEEMLIRLDKDAPNMGKSNIKLNIHKNRYAVSNKSIIECKVREWESYDLDFWKSYGITLPWLKFGEIYPISHTFITKEGKTYTFPAEKYAYAYVERKDNKVTLKIYQPFSKTRKWINSNDASVWDLWNQLPDKGNKLIITSSRKDALCIWENTLIPAISMQGEGYIPKQKVIDELKSRFKHIWILFDNDFDKPNNPGEHYAQFLSEAFNIPYIEIPKEYKAKDPSDLVKKYNINTLKQLIKKLCDTEED